MPDFYVLNIKPTGSMTRKKARAAHGALLILEFGNLTLDIVVI